MRVPLSWLSELVEDLPPVDEVAETLTMSGLEVEAIERPDLPASDSLVVARIEEMQPHPNADRLSLCAVFDGQSVRPVVCGATNMKAGDHVVLAKPGAWLTGGHKAKKNKIKKSKIRGQVSEGMLCSAAELGTVGSEDGIIILPSETEPGESAAEVLGLGESILEVAVTPNRGDCLSLLGLAREVSAVCKRTTSPAFRRLSPLSSPSTSVSAGGGKKISIPVSIEEGSGCLAYRGLLIDDVRVGPSPPWIQRRLAACGVRPINNLVDITNYVLFELGQPLHAFDAARLKGPSIHVRALKEPVDFDTLDGERRKIMPGDIVICDASGPVALAGVMGGASSAVDSSTTSVFLEAAVFASERIRATSRRLGLISESSYRFERGVDPARVEAALMRAASLLEESGAGQPRPGLSRAGALAATGPEITLRLDRIERVLGAAVSAGETGECLGRLGIETRVDGHQLIASVPSYRHDLTAEIDLIEEVARLVGYERFQGCTPSLRMHEARMLPIRTLSVRLRRELVAIGMSEAVGLSFCSPQMNRACPGLHAEGSGALVVKNPLRDDAGELRRSLLPVLLEALSLNGRNGVKTLDLFIIGRTMSGAGDEAHEDEARELDVVAGMISGLRRGRKPGFEGQAVFWDMKAAVERIAGCAGCDADLEWVPTSGRPEYHPGSASEIRVRGSRLGFAGQIHPVLAETLEVGEETYLFEIDSRKLVEYASPHPGLQRIGKFPGSTRDVSFEAPVELLAGEIVAIIRECGADLVDRVSVFDDYRSKKLGRDRKALGVSVVYRSNEKTLTDEEVSEVHERVVARVAERLGISVRA